MHVLCMGVWGMDVADVFCRKEIGYSGEGSSEALMNQDATICYCFHVTRRKLASFLRIERPRVPSQLSQCGGAGTGCGWCISFLEEMFEQAAGGNATSLE